MDAQGQNAIGSWVEGLGCPRPGCHRTSRKKNPPFKKANVRKANRTLPTGVPKGEVKRTIGRMQEFTEEAEQGAEYGTEREDKKRLRRYREVAKETEKYEASKEKVS